MNEKGCIIKTIIQMSGKYSEFEVFTDWVRIMAYSIQNACCIWHDDEEKSISSWGTPADSLMASLKLLTRL